MKFKAEMSVKTPRPITRIAQAQGCAAGADFVAYQDAAAGQR
jgi:hypothetical protein